MRVALTASCVFFAMTGCKNRDAAVRSTEEPSCPSVIVQHAPGPTRCVQIQGEDVGRLPLELHLGDGAIRLAEWTLVDEASPATVGFAAQLPSDVVYAVKAGEAYFTGRGPRWLHPSGVSGPRVHPIEAVSFCRVVPTKCGSSPVFVEAQATGGAVASR